MPTVRKYTFKWNIISSVSPSVCLWHTYAGKGAKMKKINKWSWYSGTRNLPLPDCSIILGITTFLYMCYIILKPLPRLPDSSVILGVTTRLYLTGPPYWGLLKPPPRLPGSSVILGVTTRLYLTGPQYLGLLVPSTWQAHHPGDHYPPLSGCSIILVSIPSSTWQFHHPGDHYTLLPDSSIILGTTTHLSLTSSCGLFPSHHYSPLPNSLIILGTTTHPYLTIPSSWNPQSTSTCQCHRPGDHYHCPHQSNSLITLMTTTHLYMTVTIPETVTSSIILGKTTHAYLTVPTSWGNYPPLPDCYINLGITKHLSLTVPKHHFQPLPDCSIIPGTISYFNLTVPSSWGPPLDCFIILGITTVLYLTIPSTWGPLRTYTCQFNNLGDNYPHLPHSFIILGAATHLFILRTNALSRRLFVTLRITI